MSLSAICVPVWRFLNYVITNMYVCMYVLTWKGPLLALEWIRTKAGREATPFACVFVFKTVWWGAHSKQLRCKLSAFQRISVCKCRAPEITRLAQQRFSTIFENFREMFVCSLVQVEGLESRRGGGGGGGMYRQGSQSRFQPIHFHFKTQNFSPNISSLHDTYYFPTQKAFFLFHLS